MTNGPALDPLIELILLGALAVLWLAAAGHKARDLSAFRATLADYRLLPPAWTAAAAPVLVAGELLLATALLVPATRRAALLASACLLGTYSAAIAINLARGRRHIDCGCMGPALAQPLSGWLLARNAVLIAAALVCLQPVAARPLVWLDLVSATGAGAVMIALYRASGQLIANAPGLARLRGSG